ncbi:MAG: hypothetical protein R3F59_08445 [Myxococcota bacterium]
MLGAPLLTTCPRTCSRRSWRSAWAAAAPGAELVLTCDTIPCSGAVVLDPSAGER